jgi:hypothetical protein
MSSTVERREGCVAFCNLADRRITIATTQSREEQEISFIHELLHSIWPPGVVGDKTEERLISKLEEPLRALFIDNDLID